MQVFEIIVLCHLVSVFSVGIAARGARPKSIEVTLFTWAALWLGVALYAAVHNALTETATWLPVQAFAGSIASAALAVVMHGVLRNRRKTK
jgi:hypothetical protein